MSRIDIRNYEDVELLVETFYQKLMSDSQLKPFFSEVVTLDLDEHLPRITDFWVSVLFGDGGYRGNPVAVHVKLNQLRKIRKEDFNRWLMFWNDTIDEMYHGDKAEEAKSKAQVMAELMQIKIGDSSSHGFIQ